MGDVVVASTTDDQASVNAAAGGEPQDNELPPEKPAPTGKPQIENEEPNTPEPEPGAAAPEKQEETVPKGVQKRIDKFRAQLTAAQKEIEELKARTNGQTKVDGQQASQDSSENNQRAAVPTEVAAKFDTFDAWSEKQLTAGKPANIDDFLEARDAWKDARRAQQEEQKAAQEYEKSIETTYQDGVNAFKEEHSDWDEIVGEAEIAIPVVAGNAIKQLENGPAVVYFLAQNEKIAKKISEMSPVLAVAEIGRIAARLEKLPAEETPTNNTTTKNPDRQPIVSKAPAPITPLKGGGVRISKDLSDPNIPYDEYRKLRDEQTKARFRR